MTIQELNEYRVIRAEIKAIEEEIKDLHILRTSSGNEIGAGRVSARNPTSPTEQIALRTIELEERRAEELARLVDFQLRITEWIDEIDDPEVKTIVRLRYNLGYSWKKVSWEMGNRLDRRYAYNKLHRYLKKK